MKNKEGWGREEGKRGRYEKEKLGGELEEEERGLKTVGVKIKTKGME